MHVEESVHISGVIMTLGKLFHNQIIVGKIIVGKNSKL